MRQKKFKKIDELKGKKVKIGVAFNDHGCYGAFTKHYEGVIKTCTGFGGETFVVFEDNSMINAKYIQTIEIIG